VAFPRGLTLSIVALSFVVAACGAKVAHPDKPPFRCLSGAASCPGEPRFTCLPTRAVFGGCSGFPGLWGWKPSPQLLSLRFPVDCEAELPVENPFYPGGPQPCSCDSYGFFSGAHWGCPV
jgi:hypothetical protein